MIFTFLKGCKKKTVTKTLTENVSWFSCSPVLFRFVHQIVQPPLKKNALWIWCHPCAGVMLISCISFQFYYLYCRSKHFSFFNQNHLESSTKMYMGIPSFEIDSFGLELVLNISFKEHPSDFYCVARGWESLVHWVYTGSEVFLPSKLTILFRIMRIFKCLTSA